MNLYFLAHLSAFLFLTHDHPTTFRFDSPVEFYTLGKQGDFFSYLSKDKKILVIKPKIKRFDIPLIVITKKRTYQFRFKNGSQKSNIYIVRNGLINKLYKKIKSNNLYSLFLGKSSFRIRAKNKITINGKVYQDGEFYLLKGSDLVINGEKIVY